MQIKYVILSFNKKKDKILPFKTQKLILKYEKLEKYARKDTQSEISKIHIIR